MGPSDGHYSVLIGIYSLLSTMKSYIDPVPRHVVDSNPSSNGILTCNASSGSLPYAFNSVQTLRLLNHFHFNQGLPLKGWNRSPSSVESITDLQGFGGET
ncbi:hypothetical protein PIIN_10434 [Serendipita indica DSM 11827]|uniref:Uncharacterized protein n=1 Tax=Serendipita indica (strain DSM 11827) TaxID=1109443 RepID=G4TYP8_SERID|nr:hypothetical protein PIIN_10434 [Serendipita indica DSM 11827]